MARWCGRDRLTRGYQLRKCVHRILITQTLTLIQSEQSKHNTLPSATLTYSNEFDSVIAFSEDIANRRQSDRLSYTKKHLWTLLGDLLRPSPEANTCKDRCEQPPTNLLRAGVADGRNLPPVPLMMATRGQVLHSADKNTLIHWQAPGSHRNNMAEMNTTACSGEQRLKQQCCTLISSPLLSSGVPY